MVMGDTAEVVAKRYKILTGSPGNAYSLESQKRTARAQKECFFSGEIAPMQTTKAIFDKKTGEKIGEEPATCDRDECNRPDTTLEGLLALKPHFDQTSGEGTVTAGNSSQLSDGASATLLMSRERADALGIPYKLIFRGFAVAGCEPDEMGIGPVFAVPKLLKRQGLKMSDIDLWELNEAFAVQVIYCRDRLGIPQEILNVNGGSISIGHPFGMTGSRIVGTIANRDGSLERDPLRSGDDVYRRSARARPACSRMLIDPSAPPAPTAFIHPGCSDRPARLYRRLRDRRAGRGYRRGNEAGTLRLRQALDHYRRTQRNFRGHRARHRSSRQEFLRRTQLFKKSETENKKSVSITPSRAVPFLEI